MVSGRSPSHHLFSPSTHSQIGVYLSLKGVVYTNNSVIPITEIGETNTTSNTGLQCITDRRPCCAAIRTRAGEWYFPNGTIVPSIVGGSITFYRTRGDDGTVDLNRMSCLQLDCSVVWYLMLLMLCRGSVLTSVSWKLILYVVNVLPFFDIQLPVSLYRSETMELLQL